MNRLLLVAVVVMALLAQLSVAISQKNINAILKKHNQYRAKHGAPALKWDKTVAQFAQKWTNGCVFQHSGVSAHRATNKRYTNSSFLNFRAPLMVKTLLWVMDHGTKLSLAGTMKKRSMITTTLASLAPPVISLKSSGRALPRSAVASATVAVRRSTPATTRSLETTKASSPRMCFLPRSPPNSRLEDAQRQIM